MAVFTQTADRSPVSRLGRAARAAVTAVTFVAQRAIRPHKAALGNLLHIPLTAAGTGCIDYAAFHLGAGWGWLATGISLVLVEHIIADEVR